MILVDMMIYKIDNGCNYVQKLIWVKKNDERYILLMRLQKGQNISVDYISS